MITLQHAVICENVQELAQGSLNYINVFSEIFDTGYVEFDFVTSWYGEKGSYKEDVVLYSPSGNIVAETTHAFDIQEFFHDCITTFEVELDEPGTYFIEVRLNNTICAKVPFIVYQNTELI